MAFDDIDMLLGLGSQGQQGRQERSALANQLRGDRELGQILLASPTLASVGQSLVSSSASRAKSAGAAYEGGLKRTRQKARDERTDFVSDRAFKQNTTKFEHEQSQDEYQKAQDKIANANTQADYEQALVEFEQKQLKDQQGYVSAMEKIEAGERKDAATERNKIEAAELAHKRSMEAQAAKDEEARKRENIKAQAAAAKGVRLTPGQLQLGMDKLEKKIKPLEDVMGAVANMDKVLAPYAKGGAASGVNIPGLGFIEGSRGKIGDIVRMGLGQEAQDVFRNTQNILTKLIKESAGLAQTLTETANVLKGLGAQDLTNEESYLKGLTELKEALAKDQKRIMSSTHPQVLEQYNSAYVEGDINPLTQVTADLDFTSRYAPRPGEAPVRRSLDPTVQGEASGVADELAEIEAQLKAARAREQGLQ